jgi:SpoVK/Ycf46/Vps4 family AAA+-type ATPase
MTPNETIQNILKALNSKRTDLAYESAEAYIKTLPQSSQIRYNIKHLINQRPPELKQMQELPQNIKQLCDVSPTIDHMHLDPKTDKFLKTLLLEWQYRERFLWHNLKVKSKILLHGPTGNGKTTFARYMAHRFDLPLIEVKSGIIDSHMGTTARNVEQLFKSIDKPCILFWDEVDSIGFMRGRDREIPEMDRVTNSFLTNIDRMSNESIFIGATNRLDQLDPAFHRRFDVAWEMQKPDIEQRAAVYSSLLKQFKITAYDAPVNLNEEYSYHEIFQVVVESARAYVLNSILQVAA